VTKQCVRHPNCGRLAYSQIYLVEANRILGVMRDVWHLDSLLDGSPRLQKERYRLGMNLITRKELLGYTDK
jgi:hypothetical protein